MRFEYLIFDVDDTLLDFREAYSSAQRAVAEQLGVPFSDRFIRADEELGWKNWRALRLDKTDLPDVQQNYHNYYDQYLELHYKALCEHFGVRTNAAELIECYQNALAASHKLVEPTAMDVYASLAQTCKTAIATNGIGWIQRARMKDFLPFTSAVFISEEMGVIKPSETFFEMVLSQLGCSPERCLMVGDSLSNDIIGAKGAGLSTCWYNRKRRDVPEGLCADHVIESIDELENMLH